MPNNMIAAGIEYDEIETETDLAILIVIDGRKVWIPKSQILNHDEEEKWMDLPEWLAIEKELV